LEAQIDDLLAARDTVMSLAEATVLLGAFAEAELLVVRHDASIAQLRSLLEGVQEAVRFAEEVTHTVAASYRAGDQQAAHTLAVPTGGGAV